MGENEETKTSLADQVEQDFNSSIDEFVDAIVEDMAEEEEENALESVESHQERIRNEIHGHMEEFRATFLEGYEVLMEELALLHGSSESSKDEVPPHSIRL